jgi:hypothetical protein
MYLKISKINIQILEEVILEPGSASRLADRVFSEYNFRYRSKWYNIR